MQIINSDGEYTAKVTNVISEIEIVMHEKYKDYSLMHKGNVMGADYTRKTAIREKARLLKYEIRDEIKKNKCGIIMVHDG